MKYDVALYRATVLFPAGHVTFIVSAYNLDIARKHVGLEFAAGVWSDGAQKQAQDAFGKELIEYGTAAHAFAGNRNQIPAELEGILKGAFGNDVRVVVEQVK